MPGSLERSQLRVEGPDDQHSLIHLLRRHGIDYDTKPWPREYPEIKEAGGDNKLLDSMQSAIELASGRSVGFVLDADRPISARWDQVRERLRRVEVDAPPAPIPEGFLGRSTRYKSMVGVWLMPDNCYSGALEDFLRMLIGGSDPLIPYAFSAAARAKYIGAEFSINDIGKATIHTWLAWQSEPGLPYGTAMKAKFFQHDVEVAHRFCRWFKALYGIS